MESIRKITLCLISLFMGLFFVSCGSTTFVLPELSIAAPDTNIVEEEQVENVYTAYKILEITEENGVQKYVLIKVDQESLSHLVRDENGEIVGKVTADMAGTQEITTCKEKSRSGGIVRLQLENSTHKIPKNSYVLLPTGIKKAANK